MEKLLDMTFAEVCTFAADMPACKRFEIGGSGILFILVSMENGRRLIACGPEHLDSTLGKRIRVIQLV